MTSKRVFCRRELNVVIVVLCFDGQLHNFIIFMYSLQGIRGIACPCAGTNSLDEHPWTRVSGHVGHHLHA